MKRILTMLICTVLLMSLVLCSCSSNDSDKDTSGDSSVTAPKSLVPHLEKTDYSGRTLTVLSTWDHFYFSKIQISPQEMTSEPVNDAYVNRNRMLEQEYGFKIESIFTPGWDDYTDKVRNDMMADAANYDVVSIGAYYLAPLAAEGYLLDLRQIENSNLRLNEKWWDVSANEDMSMGGSLYFTTGDIFVLDDETTCVTYFNKDIINELNLENPYELVYNGKWTIDKMYEMVKAASHEDGDGEMNCTGGDRWGFVGTAFDTYKYIVGCDSPMVEKDEQDYPVLAMGNERNINAFNKVHAMLNDKQNAAYQERFFAWNDPAGEVVKGSFYNGNALFLSEHISAVSDEKMRTANIHYGILPNPKLDEQQEKYTSPVEPYSFFCLGIPTSNKDLDFTTFALEAMAYTGMTIVKPEYYVRTIQTKRFADNDSPEMLDIIFSNRVVDISTIFNWGDCIQYYNQLLRQDTGAIASFIEAESGKFQTAMEATKESFKIK